MARDTGEGCCAAMGLTMRCGAYRAAQVVMAVLSSSSGVSDGASSTGRPVTGQRPGYACSHQVIASRSYDMSVASSTTGSRIIMPVRGHRNPGLGLVSELCGSARVAWPFAGVTSCTQLGMEKGSKHDSMRCSCYEQC